MTLTEIRLTSLFGRFDHTVKLDRKSKLTILTAPNGYGKTALLSLVRSFFRKEFLGLQSYPYAELMLLFSNRTGVRISRPSEDLFGAQTNTTVSVFDPVNIKDAEPWQFDRSEFIQRTEAPSFERYIPFIERIGVDRWLNEQTEETYSTVEVFQKFSEHLPERLRRPSSLPDWLSRLTDAFQCHLIETQRLLDVGIDPQVTYNRRRYPTMRPTVERNAQHLATRIGDELKAYALESQKRDESFPKRVLQQLKKLPPPEQDIRDRLVALERKRSELVAAALIDKATASQISQADVISDDYIRNLLLVWLEDTEAKLSHFDDIHRRIKLFQQIVNAHFNFKSIRIDPKSGIEVRSDSGHQIPLQALSSGEQHELILIYELLFKVSGGALIFIDEPELSLHVAWQKTFIADLEQIQKLVPLHIVLATHSPQIINDRWDLVVELQPPK